MVLDKVFDLASRSGIFERAPWRHEDIVWREFGLKIRRRFLDLVSEEFGASEYEEILLPALIPDATLRRQADHYRDIKEISFLLEQQSCYLRSTSESQFAEYLGERPISKTTRHFQICSVFRKERQSQQIPLVRSIEINPFVESMAFGSEARTLVDEMAGIYKRILHRLCIPFVVSRRPLWDTFPEARTTLALDTAVPGLGITQSASIHDLGTSFARSYRMRLSTGGLPRHISAGMSGRALLVALALHAQEEQILLPTSISPVVIGVHQDVFGKWPDLALTLKVFSNVAAVREALPAFRPPIYIALGYDKDLIACSLGNGYQYSFPPRMLPLKLPSLLAEYDEWLLSRAESLHRQGVEMIHEIASCGRPACLFEEILRGSHRRLLGFGLVRSYRELCCSCGAKPTFRTRFSLAV